jgi:hypothetical protein
VDVFESVLIEESTKLIVGHSHALAYGSGMKLLRSRGFVELDYKTICANDYTNRSISENLYWEKIIGLAKTNKVFIIWNGNQHIANFLLRDDPAISLFDDFHPSDYLASRDHFFQFFESSFIELTQYLEKIGNLKNVSLVGTVAPKRNSLVYKNIARDEYFIELIKSRSIIFEKSMLTSENLRRGLHSIIQDSLEAISQKYCINFIPTSKESQDEENFLLPFYSAEDASHANGEYGALMIRKIESFFKNQLS